MLQFSGFSVSVQQSSSEGLIGHKTFFSANLFSKYVILMLVKSRQLVIFLRMSLDDLLQQNPPPVSHILHLLMFSGFLTLDHRLW
jgi:hypothetical protein